MAKSRTPGSPFVFCPEPGLAAVDDWLDNFIQEKAVLLVISVRLEPKNPNGRQNPPPRCCWQTD